MITSNKDYTKTKKQTKWTENPSTNGKSKTIQTKWHKEAYTLRKREKGKIYMYLYIYLKKGREQPNQ